MTTLPASLTRRAAGLALAATALFALNGCATLGSPRGEVSSFGAWPAGRAAGLYAFDRLPSQQQAGDEQATLERLAATALKQAGFEPAAAGQKAEYKVQIGARVSQQRLSPWDDPFWWRLGVGGVRGPWHGSFGWAWSTPYMNAEYEREAAVLIRDAESGAPLYEARARNTGGTPGSDRLVEDLFRLSMAEFPAARPEPHAVVISAP